MIFDMLLCEKIISYTFNYCKNKNQVSGVRYYFRINTMLGSSLPPVVCSRMHVLFTLCVFVCVQWWPTYIVLCFLYCLSSSCVLYMVVSNTYSGVFCFVCLSPVSRLPVSLDCPFLIAPSVSLMFIYHTNPSRKQASTLSHHIVTCFWLWCRWNIVHLFKRITNIDQ